MNKKVNTILFIVGATLGNILVTVLLFLLLLVLYSQFIMRLLPGGAQAWSFSLMFIAAITGSFFAYRFALKLLFKKIDMDKYFDPVFIGKTKDKESTTSP